MATLDWGGTESNVNRPLLLHWSFVTGLIGGILIVLGTVFMVLMMAMMGGMMGMMMPMMQGSMQGMSGWFVGMGVWMLLWAAILGTVAMVGALRIRTTPAPLGWGIALVVAGVLSFPVMGGFLVGGLATMASGVLAIAATAPGTATLPASG